MSGISLSTGTVVPVDVTKDLLGAHQVGEEAYHMFKKKRLEEATSIMKFHDKITKQNLKTFSSNLYIFNLQAGQHPPDAQVTQGQSMLLFLQYIMKYNISGDQLEHLCKLFEIHLPNILPKSKYLLKKFPVHLLYDVYMYCLCCKGCLGKSKN